MPILVADGQVIQGSAEIIDWVENRTPGSAGPLTPDSDMDACREIEKRLDEIAGVHVRRYYYSDALFNQSDTVKNIYANDVSSIRRFFVNGTWGQVRKVMIKAMDLGPEQGLESKEIIQGELDWIEEMLSGGRRYLVGDRFSRADLTAASLLSPLVIPKEHPKYPEIDLPEGMSTYIEELKDRPSINWVREIYRQHR